MSDFGGPSTVAEEWRPRPSRRRLSARLDRLSEGRFGAVMAAPGLLLVLLFVVPPVAIAVGMSFFRIELGRDDYTPFVALRNFVVRLPADAEFLGTLPLTLAFAALTTAVAVPLALFAASTINGRRRFRGTLTLLLLLPWAVAPIADGLLWLLLLDPTDGIVAKLLRAVGLRPIFIGQAPGALLAMILAVTWRAIPLLGVLFIGALRQVPPDLGRAARLDGASRVQAFRYVTLPAIRPTVIAASLLQIILALQTFDIQFALSNDNPPKGALLAGLRIYHTVINEIALGYGAAQTMALALFIAACLWLLWALVVRPTRDRPPAEADEAPRGAGSTTRLPGLRRDPGASLASAPSVSAGGPRREVGGPSAASRAAGRARGAAGRVIGWGATVGLVAFLAGPLLWLLLSSVQSDIFLRMDPPKLGPFLFNSFFDYLGDGEWQAAALVSITVTTGATLLALLIAALTAYPLARSSIRGGRALIIALMGTQLIPPIALAIPILYIFIRLDLRNTIPGLVLINAAFWAPILVFLVRGAFLAVPRNLDLAARIDGASRVGVVLRVMAPAAAPAIIAATAIVFVGIWNDFVFAAVIGGRDTYTLPRFLGTSASPTLHTLAVKIVLTILPCIAIIALVRRRIVGLL